jgi:hypothetical protein
MAEVKERIVGLDLYSLLCGSVACYRETLTILQFIDFSYRTTGVQLRRKISIKNGKAEF